MASTAQLIGVFLIDFVAFTLALLAEQTITTAKLVMDHEFNYIYCVYDSNIATKFGIAAAALLLLTQTLRFFWFKKEEKYGISRYLLSMLCWGTFLIGEGWLLMGSMKNSERIKYRTIFNREPPNCNTMKKGIFEVGAAFVMLTSLLSNFNSTFCFNSCQSPNTSTTQMGTYTLLP